MEFLDLIESSDDGSDNNIENDDGVNNDRKNQDGSNKNNSQNDTKSSKKRNNNNNNNNNDKNTTLEMNSVANNTPNNDCYESKSYAKKKRRMNPISETNNNNNNNDANNNSDRTKTTSTTEVNILSSSQIETSNFFKRGIPHQKGHWYGHVMIPIMMKLLDDQNHDDDNNYCNIQEMQQLSIRKIQSQLKQVGYSGTIIQHDEIHLSLTKPFTLQLAFIDSFVHHLRQQLQFVSQFSILIDTSEQVALVNDEKTRTFQSWQVSSSTSSSIIPLHQLIQKIDCVMTRYNLPLYYNPPIFHTSFASISGNVQHYLLLPSKNQTIASCNISNTIPSHENNSCCQNNNSNSYYGNDNNNNANIDSSDDNYDDDAVHEVLHIPVTHIICTFGKVKRYIIELANKPNR